MAIWGAAVRVTIDEMDVLHALADRTRPDEFYSSFAPLERQTGFSRSQVRLCCRSLARKGLASYSAGLWTEDGEIAGAGYAITALGRAKTGLLSEDASAS